MTGDHQRQRITGIGLTNRSRSTGFTELGGNFPIGAGMTVFDTRHDSERTTTKRSSGKFQGQVESLQATFEISTQLSLASRLTGPSTAKSVALDRFTNCSWN